MNNLREVNNDILKDWLNFKKEDLCSLTCDEDRKHYIYFEKILKHVPKKDKKYVQKQFSFLDENFMDYIDYWMRSIIEMCFVIEGSGLLDVVMNNIHFTLFSCFMVKL